VLKLRDRGNKIELAQSPMFRLFGGEIPAVLGTGYLVSAGDPGTPSQARISYSGADVHAILVYPPSRLD
jgi:hypothetical protein